MNKKLFLFILAAIILPNIVFAVVSFTPKADVDMQNRYAIINTTNINGQCYVQVNNASDLQAKVNNCGGSEIILPEGTYNFGTIGTPLSLISDTYIHGVSKNGVNIYCPGLSSCIKATDGGRIFTVQLENMEITGDLTSGSKGLNLVNISASRFDSLKINSFDYGISGTAPNSNGGLNYYNDYYNLQVFGNNNNFWFANASNEQHFYGGYSTGANEGGLMLFIDSSTNSIKFFGFSFEGTNETLLINGVANSLIGVRFETDATGARDINITGSRNQIIGGQLSNTRVYNTGTNNYVFMPDTDSNLGVWTIDGGNGDLTGGNISWDESSHILRLGTGGSSPWTGTLNVVLGNSTNELGLITTATTAKLYTTGLPIEITSDGGLTYFDKPSVDNAILLRNSTGSDLKIQHSGSLVKITGGNLAAVLDWSNLTNFPSACPAGSFVTQVGTSITCTSLVSTQNTFLVNQTINQTLIVRDIWMPAPNGTLCTHIYDDGTGFNITRVC